MDYLFEKVQKAFNELKIKERFKRDVSKNMIKIIYQRLLLFNIV